MSQNPLVSKPSRIDSLLGAFVLLGLLLLQASPTLGLALVAGSALMLALRVLNYRMKRGERRPPVRR